jgi:hypothetical protein
VKKIICSIVALGMVLSFAISAQAETLASWRDSGCATGDAVCTEAFGITAGDLTGNVPIGNQSGYVVRPPEYAPYAWSAYGSYWANLAEFELTMTAASAAYIDTFDFSLFNNDCQVGYGYQTWCSTATWAVKLSVNGGPWGADLGQFYSGPPSIDPGFSVTMNQALNPGDTIAVLVYSVDVGSSWPGSGQYFFHDISLNGIAPEPDSDGDGVNDTDDLCPGTVAAADVGADGCSGEQNIANACDSTASWNSHGKYVSCVAQAAEDAVAAGLITDGEKDAIVSREAQTDIGKKAKPAKRGK